MKLYIKHILLLTLLINSSVVIAQGVTLRGTFINPPQGEVEEILDLRLFVEAVDGDETVYTLNKTITIEHNQSFVRFEFEVPPSNRDLRYRIGYKDCVPIFYQRCKGYTPRAYLSESGLVYEVGSAKLLSRAELSSNINLTLLELIPLQVRINRPDYVTPETKLSLRLQVESVDRQGNRLDAFQYFGYRGDDGLAPNQDQRMVTIYVPPMLEGGIRLQYNSCYECGLGFEKAFYSDNSAVLYKRNATVISGRNLPSFVDLKFIERVNLVANLNRPAGMDASRSINLNLELKVNDDDPQLSSYERQVVYLNKSYSLQEGQASSTIEIPVPRDSEAQYEISYYCLQCFGIASQGYYAREVMTSIEADQEFLMLSDLSTTIDLNLVPALVVSGVIIRPAETSISEPISLQMRVLGRPIGQRYSTNVGYASAGIDPGANEGTFNISLDPIQGYQYELSYTCSDFCGGVSEVGYYNIPESVPSEQDALSLTIEEAQELLVFKLIPAKVVSGLIIRPESSNSDTAIHFDLLIEGFDDEDKLETYKSVRFTLPASLSRFPYSVSIPPRAHLQYKISYSCFSCSGVATKGSYRKDGLFYYSKEPDILSFEDLTPALDLALIGTFSITGQLQRPPQMSNSESIYSNMRVRLLADDGSTDYVYSRGSSGYIRSGDQAGDFQIEVPLLSDVDYTLSYQCSSCNEIWSEGFYTLTGSSFFESESSQLAPLDFASPISFQIIGESYINGRIKPPPELASNIYSYSPVAVVSILDESGNEVAENEGHAFLDESGDYEFNLGVPNSNDIPKSYILSYACNYCDQIVERGYFSDQGTVIDAEQADVLDQNVFNIQGIEMDLVAERIIHLNLLKPSNTAYPSFELGLTIDLAPVGVSFDDSSSTISRPHLFAPWTRSSLVRFNLPPNQSNQYRIRYRCSNCSEANYHSLGYLGSDNAVYSESDAAIITAGIRQQPINLVLLNIDTDGDEVPDISDNCADVLNPEQANLDRDSLGDACDSDIDGDRVAAGSDLNDYDPNLCGLDIDEDGCDDCLSGRNNPLDDGEDLDGDGVCTYNPEFCFPLKSKNNSVSMICL